MFSGWFAVTIIVGLMIHRCLDLWGVGTKIQSLAIRAETAPVKIEGEIWYRLSIEKLSKRFDIIAACSLYLVMALLLFVGAAFGSNHLRHDLEGPALTSIALLFSIIVSALNAQYEHLRSRVP